MRGSEKQIAWAIVEALKAFPAASVVFFEELSYNEYTFSDVWNDAHPGDPKIFLADDL